MEYYPAYICKNGHVISSWEYTCASLHCRECSAPVISHCPTCNTVIEGNEIGTSGGYRPPAYCHHCGQPYPWTELAIQTALQILAEDPNLSKDECNEIGELLTDVMSETPKTRLVAARLKKALAKLGNFASEALKQFILDYGCTLLKQLLDLL